MGTSPASATHWVNVRKVTLDSKLRFLICNIIVLVLLLSIVGRVKGGNSKSSQARMRYDK